MRQLILLLCWVSATMAAETALAPWRVAPVMPLPPVAFGDSTQKTGDLLDEIALDWDSLSVWSDAARVQNDLTFSTTAARACALAGTYLRADAYGKVTIEVTGTRPLKLFADGQQIAQAVSADSGEFKASAELTLNRMRTAIVVASASQASDSGAWTIHAKLIQDSASTIVIEQGGALQIRPASFTLDAQIHDFPSLVISPNGKLLVVKRAVREGDHYEQRVWHEIYELDGLKLVHSTKLAGVSDVAFSHDSKRLYYKLSTDDGPELWEQTLATKATRRLLKAVERMEKFAVLPDGAGVIYAVSKEQPENTSGYDLFRDLGDRPTGYNDRRELFYADLRTGLTRPLTKAGEFDLHKWSLSPNAERLLLIRNLLRHERPFAAQEFWTYELADGALARLSNRSLLKYPQDITWQDDLTVAYAAGSHDAAPEDTVYHNVSQLCLYTLDLRTGETRNLTADARFSLNDEGDHSRIHYNPADQSFLLHVSDGGERQFARVARDGARLTYRPLNIRWNFTDNPAMAENGTRIAYQASDYDSPRAVYVYDVAAQTERLLLDPNREQVRDWEFGTMEPWNFTNRLGEEIEGWIYKPANFSADRPWPTIVYYYAGVSPRDLRFSFQYQMWLANGYVVYVLNPVGSAAYGQKFADYHAGDWGTEATQDVIEGTEKILAAHPWMDKTKVGCYGGSYGGFVTLDLLTKSKLFACAVDMYGISNIANYFGGGVWGYWYSDIAAPGQYPWNNRDLYVNNSPIFNADKITTPTLILHGGADTNVPWLESDQMFVALTLLDRDVVYARFKDETHNINKKYENLILHRQMMLEWFDKYLKGQPAAWEERMKAWGK